MMPPRRPSRNMRGEEFGLPFCRENALFPAAILALLLSLAPGARNGQAAMVVQTCFSPAGKCSARIIRELEQAQKEILVALYAFTNDDLAWTLITAHQRGVRVYVVLDRDFDRRNESSKGSLLEREGLTVRRITGAKNQMDNGLMHQKFAVIDRRVLVTGSYNWTHSAEKFNDENILFFREAGALAEEYRKEFFRLWEKK
jgi:phosphatidylserine/phosphatidylglycerophosphate/cardiolipin synthase-like enzyme